MRVRISVAVRGGARVRRVHERMFVVLMLFARVCVFECRNLNTLPAAVCCVQITRARIVCIICMHTNNPPNTYRLPSIMHIADDEPLPLVLA